MSRIITSESVCSKLKRFCYYKLNLASTHVSTHTIHTILFYPGARSKIQFVLQKSIFVNFFCSSLEKFRLDHNIFTENLAIFSFIWWVAERCMAGLSLKLMQNWGSFAAKLANRIWWLLLLIFKFDHFSRKKMQEKHRNYVY